MTVGSKVFHHILKRKCMFNIIETLHKLKSFEAFQVAVSLCIGQRVCRGKLADYSNDISYFIFYFLAYFHIS